jgi:hypothetical protein
MALALSAERQHEIAALESWFTSWFATTGLAMSSSRRDSVA